MPLRQPLPPPLIHDIAEYGRFMGIADEDKHLIWIAAEGLCAPLPAGWRLYDDVIHDTTYYYHSASQTSQWEHPLDSYYRDLYKYASSNSTQTSPAIPAEVMEMAAYLGIDATTEQFALYIARLAVQAPLTDGWMQMNDDHGEVYYIDQASGERRNTHPLDHYFWQLLADERKAAREDPQPPVQWMEFFQQDGTVYYVHLLTGITQFNFPQLTDIGSAPLSSRRFIHRTSTPTPHPRAYSPTPRRAKQHHQQYQHEQQQAERYQRHTDQFELPSYPASHSPTSLTPLTPLSVLADNHATPVTIQSEKPQRGDSLNSVDGQRKRVAMVMSDELLREDLDSTPKRIVHRLTNRPIRTTSGPSPMFLDLMAKRRDSLQTLSPLPSGYRVHEEKEEEEVFDAKTRSLAERRASAALMLMQANRPDSRASTRSNASRRSTPDELHRGEPPSPSTHRHCVHEFATRTPTPTSTHMPAPHYAKENAEDEDGMLVFDAWFFEGGARGKRRDVLVEFDTFTGRGRISIDGRLLDSNEPLRSQSGRELQAWDLFVGAKISLLGRQVTLQRASQTTAKWIEIKAKRFERFLELLKGELSKYETVKMSFDNRHIPTAPGSTNLRHLLTQILEVSQRFDDLQIGASEEVARARDRLRYELKV
eukprot:TRINITY_DN10460_c0_g1_i1.p1 TRINITY_DN10460_c0_g1~~TRINITY_DN10460_c0_g1_i1.p1  ORF type:complete len:649 (-),score=110.03 TRINITY_DN10460_c0_g1_i1:1207-3153(-)